jgi:hypothetical protein
MSDGNAVVRDFVHTIERTPGLAVRASTLSRRVIDVTGEISCLLYVKGRGAAPYRWGVTANVINRLRRQSRKWFVVLLYESASTGYLLTPTQVEHNVAHVWPLAEDGDYKPSPGAYLKTSLPFSTFKTFLTQVRSAT